MSVMGPAGTLAYSDCWAGVLYSWKRTGAWGITFSESRADRECLKEAGPWADPWQDVGPRQGLP